MEQGQQPQPAQPDAAVPEAVANAAAQTQQQPDGMTGVVPTQPFVPGPDGSAVPFANPSANHPGTISNGQPVTAFPAPNAISAGKMHRFTVM